MLQYIHQNTASHIKLQVKRVDNAFHYSFILLFTYSEVNAFLVNLQLTFLFFFKSKGFTHCKLSFSISFKHQRAEAQAVLWARGKVLLLSNPAQVRYPALLSLPPCWKTAADLLKLVGYINFNGFKGEAEHIRVFTCILLLCMVTHTWSPPFAKQLLIKKLPRCQQNATTSLCHMILHD